MKATKAGLWMDHNHAYLIEFTSEPMKATMIESRLNHKLGKPNLKFGETRMHSTENRELAAYYKELSQVIRGYKEIILFGPGVAKTELFNILNGDHIFENIVIKTGQTDKMTQGEMNTFVRKYFSKR